MHASVGREVQSNRVSSVLAAQLPAGPQDPGRQDLGDLVVVSPDVGNVKVANMYAEMLEQDWVSSPDKRKSYYNHIRQESERLSRLIENVLDFSRMQRGTVL